MRNHFYLVTYNLVRLEIYVLLCESKIYVLAPTNFQAFHRPYSYFIKKESYDHNSMLDIQIYINDYYKVVLKHSTKLEYLLLPKIAIDQKVYEWPACSFAKMIHSWGNHFDKRAAWSLLYFLNYASLLWYLAQSQILGNSLYVRSFCKIHL